MNTVLETRGLSKVYKGFSAVNAVNLNVREGEIYGFLGLNGAGKTTTMRLLLGMIRPTGGEALILGETIGKGDRKIWDKVGYMVETPGYYPELTVRENLEICRRIRRLDKDAVESVMETLSIAQYGNKAAGKLSLGNAQRLGLAKALIHKPKVLLLDEPVNGLDPEGIADIRELLRSLAQKEGVSVLISSHLLDEVSKIADRIGIIHKGSLIREMSTSDLESSLDTKLVVETGDNVAALALLTKEGYDGEIKFGEISISAEAAVAHPESVAQVLVSGNLPPRKLLVQREELESYFLRAIGQGVSI